MTLNKEIEKALKRYLDALHHKDWKKFGNCLDDRFTYFTDGCIIQNKKQFLGFMEQDNWQPIEYGISDINILSSNENDLAVATYKSKFKGTIKGEEMNLNATETTVFCKTNDQWNILHSHTSNKM